MVIDALSKITLAKLNGVIGQNGEGAWTVGRKEEQMPVDVIEKALEFCINLPMIKQFKILLLQKLVKLRMNLVVMRKGRVAPTITLFLCFG